VRIIVAAAIIVAIYAGLCAARPYTRCSRCAGLGSHRGVILRNRMRPCRWCSGRGARLRYGRRVWNHFARIRDEANR
jgi:hypothetical protein